MNIGIFKLQLYKPPFYLYPPKNWEGTDSVKKDDAFEWWDKSDQKFISEVLEKRKIDSDLETIGHILDDRSDVVIFSSYFYVEKSRYRLVQVIPKIDVKSIKEIRLSNESAQVGDAVCVQWEDPIIYPNDEGTVHDLREKCKTVHITRLGYLIHKSEEGVYTSSLKNIKKDGFYRETMLNPIKSVEKIHKLL